MEKKTTILARDRVVGMSVRELRDALMGVPGHSVPIVSSSVSGKIRAITVVVPVSQLPGDGDAKS